MSCSSSSLSLASIQVEPGQSQSNPVNARPNRLTDRYALNTRLGLIMVRTLAILFHI
ncbi:hypothetical protein Hanom_Chr00s068064g01787851 [Helianthus anomalus]